MDCYTITPFPSTYLMINTTTHLTITPFLAPLLHQLLDVIVMALGNQDYQTNIVTVIISMMAKMAGLFNPGQYTPV